MKKSHRRRIIILAYCNRYLFPCLALFVPMALVPLHRSEFLLMLTLGIAELAYAAYELIGYLCRWTHIFCSYQNAYHAAMTPEDVNWGWVKRSDAYGIPAIFGGIGIIAIVAAFLIQGA